MKKKEKSVDHMKAPIKIYGKNSSKYEYFRYHLNEQLKKSGLDIEIIEVNDLNEIISSKIDAIPAIKINDDTALVCYPTQNVNDFLKKTLHQILIEHKYGNMKRILVPTDFSDSSITAFGYAHEMATKINASLTLVHYYHPNLNVVSDDFLKIVNDKLEGIVKKYETSDHSLDNIVYVDTQYKSAFAADKIIEESKSYDLVIMATSRGGGSGKWFGSVSTKVSGKAQTPVLLIPPGLLHHNVTNVLYPLKNKIKSLDRVLWLLENFNPTLHMIHFDTTEFHSPMIKELLGEYTSMLSDESLWNLIYESTKCEDIEECISNYIKTEDIDMLILEKGKEHYLEFLLHRSISEKLLNRIDIPVFILNEKQARLRKKQKLSKSSTSKIS